MNNKSFLFCILYFALINILFAQSLVINKKNNKEEIKDKFILLKFEPLQLLDPLNSIHLSCERQAGSHTSFQAGLGYIFGSYLYNNETTKLDKNAANLKVKLEYRLYCKDFEKGHANWFFAPQLFYKQAIFNGECQEKVHPENTMSSLMFTDKYKVHRQEFGLCTKTGFQKISDNGFVFELYFGPGIKYIYSTTIGKINNTEYQGYEYAPNVLDIMGNSSSQEKFKGLRLCFTVGVSIGRSFSNLAEN